MDISRMKKVFAGMSAVAISLTQMGTVAFAAYSDVPAGVWYEDAVDAFTDAGYLDESQTRFRGGDHANRAEFTKLVVELNGGILSTAPNVPSFDDVKPGAWYYGYMEEAAKEGWVKGDGNCYGSHPCNARPGANINRAEAAALIVRAFGLDASGDAPAFVDVPSNQWYTDVVQTAADHCVLQGDDATGRARPADFMNRAEMVVMLHRVDQDLTYGVDCSSEVEVEAGISDVSTIDAETLEVEFSVEIDEDAAVDTDLYAVSGASDIDVSSVSVVDKNTVELTLASAMEAGEDYTLSVEDMVTADGDTFSDSVDFEGYTEVVQGDGILEVSLASTNPSGDTVPQGANGVVLASIDLTASCDDAVVISEMTVLHEGFGLASNIAGIYAAIDGGRISRERSIDSQDQTANIRFTDPLTIPACKTKTVDIVADFGTSLTAGSEHNIAIELPSDFQSNAKDVDGNFPIRGDTFKIAAVTSGQVTVTYKSVTPNTVDIGKQKAVLGKFEVSANSTEDQTLYSITLEQNGTSSDGDVSDIFIRRTDGTVLTNVVSSTTSDYATLVFDPPFTVLEGDRITLEVVGNVEAGAADTVIFRLEETSDLFAVGSLYGYGVNGQLYGSRVTTSGTAGTVTIQAGQFSIEIDGPSAQTYTTDDDDAVFAKVIMTPGQESVDVQDLFIALQANTSSNAAHATALTSLVEDVELRNTKSGQTVSATAVSGASAQGSGTGAYQIYRFDDFVVDKQATWELRADFVADGASSGDKFKAHICTSTTGGNQTTCSFGDLIAAVDTYNVVAEGLSTGDAITDIRPGGDVTSTTHTIAAPSINIAMVSIGASDTAVKNSKNINFLRFSATAGEAEDVLLTTAVFAADAGSLLNAQNYALWVDQDGDGVVETILEKGTAATTSSLTFDDLAGGGFVVPAEETVYFEVHGDITSSPTSTTIKISFNGSNSATAVEAEEVDDGSSIATPVVTELAGKTFTIVNQGDLFVRENNKPNSRQLLAGTLGESVLRLEFRAEYEDIQVNQIQIVSTGSVASTNASATGVELLDLYRDSETTPFDTATPCTSGGIGSNAYETSYCADLGDGQFIVKKGARVNVSVRPRVKNDNAGAISASGVTFWTGSGGITAEGINSSNTLKINDADGASDGEIVINGTGASNTRNQIIRGNANDIVLAKITSVANASPIANGTSVPSGGDREIGRFRFTAATNVNIKNGNNIASLSGVIFTVAATNVDLDGGTFQWYRTQDSGGNENEKVTCGIAGSQSNSGSLSVRCLDSATALDAEIDSGESAVFVLEVDVTNNDVTAASTSTLQVSLTDFANRNKQLFDASSSHLRWDDGVATDSMDFLWIEHGETTVRSVSFSG